MLILINGGVLVWKEHISQRKDREKENTVSSKEWEQETAEKFSLAEEQEAEQDWVRNFKNVVLGFQANEK